MVASALTTPTSQTTASPGGMFTLTQTLEPVRALRGGAWRTLNPNLRANASGTVAPAVTTGGLVLSGGGDGPLAVMDYLRPVAGAVVAAGLPGAGPVGRDRDLLNVLPGVNLAVTATRRAGSPRC